MEHYLLVRMRWRPPGRWWTQSLRRTTRLAPTGDEVGGRKRPTRLSPRTVVGTTPNPSRHPDYMPDAAGSPSGSIAAGQPRPRRTTAFMNAIPINVKRTGAELAPDPTRVLLRSFTPGDVPRLERIVAGIMSISENDVGPLLDAVSAKFSGRHQQIGQLFKERF